MFKKVFFVLAVAAAAVSCLDDGPTYNNKYLLDTAFEYNNVFGAADSLYFESTAGTGIGWMDMGFHHKLNGDKTKFMGGFILSRLKGNGQSEDDRFRVNSGTGKNNSQNYIVYYSNPDQSQMPKRDIEFISNDVGTCTMVGCYVNNTKEVVNAVRNSFVTGDRLVIRMTGYIGEQKTGEQEFVLAEYTEKKDSVVTSWSPFKLDKLGNIQYIDIEIESTRKEIPAAFCMDNMIANIVITY